MDGSQQEIVDGALVEFHIAVNPELKLFSNSNGVVQSVQYINKDAETLCDSLKLEGLSYAEAFSLLAERMHTGEYLNGREVAIRVFLPAELGAQVPTWETAVEQAWILALEQNGITCSYTISLDVPDEQEQGMPGGTDQQTQNTVQDQLIDDERFEKVERDSNGNIIITVEKDQDGNKITAYYDNYPNAKEVLVEIVAGGSEQYFYSANGSLERQISIDPQGVTIERYYENNILTQEIVNGGAEVRYYENGVLRREIQNFEQAQIERIYNAQGNLERVVDKGQTITRTEEYHQEGWLQRIRFEDAEGFREDIYQADGVLFSEENSATGTKFVYDMSGNKVEAYGRDNHGRMSHIFWLADRTAIIYVHEFDGSVTKTVQAPNNGTIISEIQNYTGAETADIGTIVAPNGHQ